MVCISNFLILHLAGWGDGRIVQRRMVQNIKGLKIRLKANKLMDKVPAEKELNLL